MSRCKICFENIINNGINSLRKDLCICYKCFKEFNPKFYKTKIEGIDTLIIYDYDEIIRNKLYTLKGCYDIELAPVFLNRFIYELRLIYKGYIIVPFPSSKEDDLKRGFNHVEEIFKDLKLEFAHCLRKKFNFKQSSLTKEEREEVEQKIEAINLDKIFNKKVLIVDDVLTTGSSIKASIHLLKKANPKQIKVLLLSKKKQPQQSKLNLFNRIFKK